MNVKLIATAVAGLFTGSAITYIFTRSHYEKKIRDTEMETRNTIMEASRKLNQKKTEMKDVSEELQSMEKPSGKKMSETTTLEIKQPEKTFDQKDIDDYIDYTSGYDGEGQPRKIADIVKEKDVNRVIEGPYPISPEEYGERTDYDQETFVYYSDGILADEDGDIIESYKLSGTIGEDFKDAFGEYSEDSAWFRNDDTKCEYLVEKAREPYYGS